MILTSLEAVVYRVHQPKWSFAATSGAGAGTYGGRANRPGINALYLSLAMDTAVAEYRQLDALLPPGLIVSYKLSIAKVVDFRGGYTSAWPALWQDFYCDWRNLHFNQGIEPPSWVIGDQALAAGASGILFNSALTGGANLVVYTDALAGADTIAVHDPNNDLPRDQSSWR